MFRILFLFILLIFNLGLHSQTVITMIEDNGVFKVPCEINGLKVKMIFDTGASTLSISSLLAEMMLENNYLTIDDFKGKSKAITADGRIINNTEVLFRTVTLGDITLTNINAVVVGNQYAPLLFGQSAIQKLGSISINDDKLYITNKNISESSRALNERWDAQSYSYSNYTYGVGWKLPNSFDWNREQGDEKHTVFRAVGGPFLVFINAQIANKDADLWEYLPQMSGLIEKIDSEVENRTGKIVYERTWEKVKLFGQHAIKTTFNEYFKDSRFKQAVETYAEEYILNLNGYNLFIVVKVDKEYYSLIDNTLLKKIIHGFNINTNK